MTREVGSVGGVAERLREARNRLGYTQKQMAEALELSLQTYVRSETGARTLDLDDVQKLSDLGYSLQWLMHGDVPPAPPERHYTDPELMGRIMDAVAMAYREENQRLPAAEQGRLAAQLYDDLVLVEDADERRAVLAFLVKRHREAIRAAARDPMKNKRQD